MKCCLRYLIILLIPLLLFSCNEKKADDLDDFSYNLLCETLDAIGREDHELAKTKLEQMDKVESSKPGKKLLLREVESVAIKRSREFIDDLKFKKANQEVLDAIAIIGRTPVLQAEQDFIKAVEEIDYYNSQKPFQSASDALIAFQSLPNKSMFPDEISQKHYSEWYRGEYAAYLRTKNKEESAVVNELVFNMDYDMVNGSESKLVIYQQLKELSPGHPLVKNWNKPFSSIKSLNYLYRDILAFQLLEWATQAQKKEIFNFYRQQTPNSNCAEYIQMEGLFANKQPNLAYDRLLQLKSRNKTLDLRRIRPYLNRHFRDSPVKQTLSIDSILEQLYYLDSKE